METLFGAEREEELADLEGVENRSSDNPLAVGLGSSDELLREEVRPEASSDLPPPFPAEPIDNSRALALSDVIAPRARPGEALIRMAYRMGIPGHTLTAPFRKAPSKRLLATVITPITGDRASGVALRAGYFHIHGVKQPIGTLDYSGATRLAPGLERSVHSFSWLADLAACAPREGCTGVAERIATGWLDVHEGRTRPSARSAAWELENTGLRLLAWLVHAPLLLSGDLRSRMLESIEATAQWLDRKALRSGAGLGQVVGWAAVTAAGLLLPEGRPRRLYGEAGLIKALGEFVAEDGGNLGRCPRAQMEAIRVLTDLVSCYEAVNRDAPEALLVMRELLVPPLLALRHGDGALGNWQGHGAISADEVSALIVASRVRTRPLNEPTMWGYQRIRAAQTTVLFDAGPPPRPRHTRTGCAGTLAFELSDGPSRVIVNCGGAALAGGLVPAHIGKGLRATAAHSTLVLDDANSTAVLLHGKLGRGAETVEVERRFVGTGSGSQRREGVRVEASHDGYAQRFGLIHERLLTIANDGNEIVGEDVLVPASRKGKRGKVGIAIRFHLGKGVEAHLSEDRLGASLLTPDGKLWQLRLRAEVPGGLAGGEEVKLSLDDSLWVDDEGRPHPIEQLVIEGLASRSGAHFSWLLKKMG